MPGTRNQGGGRYTQEGTHKQTHAQREKERWNFVYCIHCKVPINEFGLTSRFPFCVGNWWGTASKQTMLVFSIYVCPFIISRPHYLGNCNSRWHISKKTQVLGWGGGGNLLQIHMGLTIQRSVTSWELSLLMQFFKVSLFKCQVPD